MPPNRAIQQRMLCRRDSHIPKGVYCLLALDRLKVSSFLTAKTSANKRFLFMSAKPIARFCSAKVVNYFELSKRRAIFLRFLLGELPPSTRQVAEYLAGKSASTKPVAVTLEILADRKQRLLLAGKYALCHGDHTVRSR